MSTNQKFYANQPTASSRENGTRSVNSRTELNKSAIASQAFQANITIAKQNSVDLTLNKTSLHEAKKNSRSKSDYIWAVETWTQGWGP